MAPEAKFKPLRRELVMNMAREHLVPGVSLVPAAREYFGCGLGPFRLRDPVSP